MKPKPAHHMRQRIIDNDLMIYIDHLKLSDRNKAIVEDYVSGKSYKEIAEKYSLSPNRINGIIFRYIQHCGFYVAKSHMYKEKE